MLALNMLAIGLVKHYRLRVSVGSVIGFCIVSIAFNGLVIFDFPRGSWVQALRHQIPFALMTAMAGGLVLAGSRRRPAELALTAVLFLISAQFLIKAIVAGLAGGGPGVHGYRPEAAIWRFGDNATFWDNVALLSTCIESDDRRII